VYVTRTRNTLLSSMFALTRRNLTTHCVTGCLSVHAWQSYKHLHKFSVVFFTISRTPVFPAKGVGVVNNGHNTSRTQSVHCVRYVQKYYFYRPTVAIAIAWQRRCLPLFSAQTCDSKNNSLHAICKFNEPILKFCVFVTIPGTHPSGGI
jgi:hypothetical protein